MSLSSETHLRPQMVAEMEIKLLMGKVKVQRKLNLCFSRSRDSSVNIVMALRTERPVRFPAGEIIFSLLHCIQVDSWFHPASYTMGNGAHSWGVKRPGYEADYSSVSSTGDKNCGGTTQPPMAWWLVN
jgi:hypothetical protein